MGQIRKDIAIIITKVGPIFRFGPYELEDLESKALFWINEKYHLYDGKRNLFNYMYTIIKNKLHNLKRNEFSRISPPCTKCPLNAYIPKTKECKLYKNLEECKYYAKWQKINSSKEQLCSVYSAEDSKDDSTRSPLQQLLINEQLELLRSILSEKNNEILEQIINNERVSKVKYDRLVGECKELLINEKS